MLVMLLPMEEENTQPGTIMYTYHTYKCFDELVGHISFHLKRVLNHIWGNNRHEDQVSNRIGEGA